MDYNNKLAIWSVVLLFLISCDYKFGDRQLKFVIVPASTSGINFSNTITENDTINLFDYYYIYNGGGIGVGDINNDDLPDLFFAGNMVSSKLFLNLGEFKFSDITLNAGVNTNRWVMGVSMVDINADGLLDIYLNIAGPAYDSSDMENMLLVNMGLNENGIPQFQESAEEYGVNDASFSVHSAFLDHDRDGDLDLFILTNRTDNVDKTFVYQKDLAVTKGETVDRFYENIGFVDSLGHAYFEEKSLIAGIIHEGYGLGLAVNDLNDDGWPDVYVANDFMPNDRLYINQKNGSFRDRSESYLQHQSYNGMGVDIADINNDLLPDIMVLDMLPDNNDRRKSMLSGMHPKKFRLQHDAGYIPQYVRNTLQLNQGADQHGNQSFSDISQLAGVNATDWSWAPLIADFDNDGDRDIFITNGFVKDMTDLDFINFDASNSYFGTKEAKRNKTKNSYNILTEVKIPNFLYQNNGDLTYNDVSVNSGIGVPSFSNGAIYCDLDNDGDLDLVTNDINNEALVYKNTTLTKNNYLKIHLKGSASNVNGIGAKVYIQHGLSQQYTFVSPTKGYLSSIHDNIHFGLGEDSLVTQVRIFWPDGTYQHLKNIQVNQTLEINYMAHGGPPELISQKEHYFFELAPDDLINFTHVENVHNDFSKEPLLLKMYSRGGPGISVGNIDDRKGEDIFIGGSAGNQPTVFFQSENGEFQKGVFIEGEENYEDMESLLFDYDNDGDNDLYVVSGGSEFVAGSANYQDRLYNNDGKGNFVKADILPIINSSGSCVAGADYDKDGDIDLFVGGRYTPGSYPVSPRSYLLKNNTFQFTDVTNEVEGLPEVGMVSSALWSDYNNDGWLDLILVGEWMPLTIFQNSGGKLKRVDMKGLAKSTGWWNVLQGDDFDNDGDIDYVAGNLGYNQDYKASAHQPFMLFADDFDKNGKIDPIFACYMKSTATGKVELFPFHGLDDLSNQIVAYKKVFRTYQQYSETRFSGVLSHNLIENAMKLEARTFASTLFINKGNEGFEMRKLPMEAQIAPIFAIVLDDIDEDGNVDIIAAGNTNASENTYGWHDASLGLCLLGDGHNNFKAIAPSESGIFLNDDVKSLVMLNSNSGKDLLVAGVNSGKLITMKRRQRKAR
ncbi:VCBS repeat-containing protein [Fulvivirgaceae bacterium BMA12]|uniref:VCBS repeat-containing protein n=1 Tax=Agaribacillus aureus TaxID=3051825 RepID=A0ABT8KZ84_9BACT|nr:VCBS repeat-containing protein [Fulvivirgaceae bacterium BMA12]